MFFTGSHKYVNQLAHSAPLQLGLGIWHMNLFESVLFSSQPFSSSPKMDAKLAREVGTTLTFIKTFIVFEWDPKRLI